MRLRPLTAPLATALLAALLGCAAQETPWAPEAAARAVYATQIPIYPGATMEDVIGSARFGDTRDSYLEGVGWWFVVLDPKDKVVAWYEARLPEARKTTDREGNVVFTITPRGADSGEDVGVTVHDGKIQVFEHTRVGKHES